MTEVASPNRVQSPRRVIIPLTSKKTLQSTTSPKIQLLNEDVKKPSETTPSSTNSLRIGNKHYQCLDGASSLKILRLPQDEMNSNNDSYVFLFKNKNATDLSSLSGSSNCTPVEDFLLDWEKSGGEGHVIVGSGSFFDASGEPNVPMIGMTLLANQKREGKVMFHQTGIGELPNIWVPFLTPEIGTLFSMLESGKSNDVEEKISGFHMGKILDPTVSLWKGKSFEDIKRFMYLYLYSDNFIEDFYAELLPIPSEKKDVDKLIFAWKAKDNEGKEVETKKPLDEFTDQDKYEFFSRGTTAFHRDLSVAPPTPLPVSTETSRPVAMSQPAETSPEVIHKIRKQMLATPKFVRDQIKSYYDHVLDTAIRKFMRAVEFYQQGEQSSGKLNKASSLFIKSSMMMASILNNIYTIGRLMKILFVYKSKRVVVYDQDDKIDAIYDFLTEYMEIPLRNVIEAPTEQHGWIDVSNINIDMLTSPSQEKTSPTSLSISAMSSA